MLTARLKPCPFKTRFKLRRSSTRTLLAAGLEATALGGFRLGAGIAEGVTDALQLLKQFPETVLVSCQTGLPQFLLNLLLLAAQVNAAEGTNRGLQDLGGEIFVLL